MTVSVPLSFIPPTDPDIVTLKIYEGSEASGPFTEIDSTPAGTYPSYITRYVTQLANSIDDWFTIAWLDSEGYESPQSLPMQGGTRTLIGEIQQRVYLKDNTFNEILVVEEAEYIVSYCYDTTDPYGIDIINVSPMWITGLAKLTWLSLLIDRALANSTVGSYTAGMISQSSGGVSALDGIEQLWRRTMARMGIGGSRVAQFQHRHERHRLAVIQDIDVSRLLSTRQEITQRIVVRDDPSGFIISRRDR